MSQTRWLRFGAVFAGLCLTIVAIIQGHRDPVVEEYEIRLPGLPAARDGTRMLLLSDTHLGHQIGIEWLDRLTPRVAALKPDFIVVAGDLIDRDTRLVWPMIPALSKLQAPLGTWVIHGNHDSFGGTHGWANVVRDAGLRTLRDESVEIAPGLRLAGVDDLGIRQREGDGRIDDKVARALAGAHRTKEGVIFVSHTPVAIDEAQRDGAGLMVCGHTHGGQIWPFNFIVAQRYSYVDGLYDHKGMPVLISRGAGTWGPRMRLWKPGVMILVTLRAP